MSRIADGVRRGHFAHSRGVACQIENVCFHFGMIAEEEDRDAPTVSADKLIGLSHQASNDLTEQAFLSRRRQAIGILRVPTRAVCVGMQVNSSRTMKDFPRVQVRGLKIRAQSID